MDLSISIGNKTLPNPVGVASGTFGFGEDYNQIMSLDQLGGLFAKALTPEYRPGNATPRMVETPSGMLNSIGLANPGLESFLENKLPFLESLNCPVILNIGGKCENDYNLLLEKLDHLDSVWGYEINISCPNVQHGGLAFGTDPVMVEELTASLRKLTKKPLILKLTPNVTDIALIAKAAENGGADGLSAINTLKGMVVDIHKKKPVIPAGIAGLSGPAVRPVGVAAVWSICRAVSIPVIGIGGISEASHAIEYLLAGASAIQIGTANFTDPRVYQKVLEGIKDYMTEEGMEKIEDFHGYF